MPNQRQRPLQLLVSHPWSMCAMALHHCWEVPCGNAFLFNIPLFRTRWGRAGTGNPLAFLERREQLPEDNPLPLLGITSGSRSATKALAGDENMATNFQRTARHRPQSAQGGGRLLETTSLATNFQRAARHRPEERLLATLSLVTNLRRTHLHSTCAPRTTRAPW